jgi:hypothetical protein
VRRDGAIIHAVLHWQGCSLAVGNLAWCPRLVALQAPSMELPDACIALRRGCAASLSSALRALRTFAYGQARKHNT